MLFIPFLLHNCAFPSGALMLLVGQQERHPTRKNFCYKPLGIAVNANGQGTAQSSSCGCEGFQPVL